MIQGVKEEKEKKAKSELEAKELAEFNETLPLVKETVAMSQEAVEGIISIASPLVADAPEEDSEFFKTAVSEIEGATTDAQEKLGDARKQINLKLQDARKYSAETRK